MEGDVGCYSTCTYFKASVLGTFFYSNELHVIVPAFLNPQLHSVTSNCRRDHELHSIMMVIPTLLIYNLALLMVERRSIKAIMVCENNG